MVLPASGQANVEPAKAISQEVQGGLEEESHSVNEIAADEFASVLDSALGLGGEALTGPEVALRAGITFEEAQRLWRACGFPEVPEDDRFFVDEDVEVLKSIVNLLDEGLASMETVLQIARATGQCASRLADAHVSALQNRIGEPLLDEQGLVKAEVAEQVASFSQATLPFLRHTLDYLWRRHLSAAVKQSLFVNDDSGGLVRAVAFADLTEFSALSRRLDEAELANVITRFEQLAFDTVAAAGGRVVKLIGDEAMFVTTDATAALSIALDLVDACKDDEVLPNMRAGLSYGRVVSIEGDVFGPTVNLASRITTFARPGSVLLSRDLREQLGDDVPGLKLRALSRPAVLKGIGRTRLYSARRSE